MTPEEKIQKKKLEEIQQQIISLKLVSAYDTWMFNSGLLLKCEGIQYDLKIIDTLCALAKSYRTCIVCVRNYGIMNVYFTYHVGFAEEIHFQNRFTSPFIIHQCYVGLEHIPDEHIDTLKDL